jgi:hypothetical protein
VARRTLLTGAVAWLVLAGAGLIAAVAGRTALLAALPPLAIDADALGGVLAVMAAGAIAIGLAHAAVLAGLARDRRWARSAGVLLASVLAVTFLALAATAAASALRETAALILSVGAVSAALVALAYGVTAARLVAELRAHRPTSRSI